MGFLCFLYMFEMSGRFVCVCTCVCGCVGVRVGEGGGRRFQQFWVLATRLSTLRPAFEILPRSK